MQGSAVATRVCVICGKEFVFRAPRARSCGPTCSSILSTWRMHVQSSENVIPVAPVRDAVLASSLSFNEIALALDWRFAGSAKRGKGDTTRLQRRLGLVTETTSRGGRTHGGHVSRTITYDLAVRIIRAAGLDPVDVEGGWL